MKMRFQETNLYLKGVRKKWENNDNDGVPVPAEGVEKKTVPADTGREKGRPVT